MSKHERETIAKLNTRFGGRIQRKGFKQIVNRYLESDGADGGCFNRRPDGFIHIEGDPDVWDLLVAIEVEKTNPLTEEKLADYASLYGTLDAIGDCLLVLMIVDRYGNPHTIDLIPHYYKHCLPVSDRFLNELEEVYDEERRQRYADEGVRFVEQRIADENTTPALLLTQEAA